MSVASRFISGSLASWLRLGVGIFTQIALVPMYLNQWDASTYGIWLGIFAFVGLADIVYIGYQTYVGNEFLRIAPSNPSALPAMFSSAVCVSAIICAAEVGLALVAVGLDWHKRLLGIDTSSNSSDAGVAIIALVVSTFLCGSLGGVTVRLLSALGHFTRMAWWGVFAGLVTALTPVIAVTLGYNLKIAGIAAAGGVLLFHVPLFMDTLRLLRRSGITWAEPDRNFMLSSFTRSLAISAKTLLEMARQQGIRLLLAPLVGAAEMAAFVTMRTGANVALQGLGTITNPLMPELMRFLAQRDQARTEAAFAVVWLVVCAAMAPAVLVLQCVAPALFTWWTVGKLAFDGWLFATLSLGVLVFAVAQPALAVVQGNNLLRPQLAVAAVSGVLVVAGLLLLVPWMGIKGTAIVLLVAEIVALLLCRRFAEMWLDQNEMHWPTRSYRRVLASVFLAGIGMFAIIAWPTKAWLWLLICGLGLGYCLISYWYCLPLLIRQRVAHVLADLPVGRSILSRLTR